MAPQGERLSPEDAFALLGDETRMAILRTVWEAPEERVPFSEIRTRVGVADSGRFNYHINELTGHFLANSDAGYALTQAGREVVRAVLAGTITDRPSIAAEPIDGQCPECDGRLLARYEERAVITCEYCGATVMWNEFPPAGLDGRTTTEFATTFDRWTQYRFRIAMAGICPNCAARMERDIDEAATREADAPASIHRCVNCDYWARVPLFGHALDHPAVVSFFDDHGVDVTSLPYWQLASLASTEIEDGDGDDSRRARISFSADGDTLRVVLDTDLAVVDSERVDARPTENNH